MEIRGMALCILSAFGFSVWPLLARASGASPGWLALMVFIPAGLANLLISGQSLREVPSGRVIGLLLACMILDLMALLAYLRMLGGGYSFSGLMTANVILMAAFTSLGGVFILHEPFTRDKAIGLVLGCVAAWLLTKN